MISILSKDKLKSNFVNHKRLQKLAYSHIRVIKSMLHFVLSFQSMNIELPMHTLCSKLKKLQWILQELIGMNLGVGLLLFQIRLALVREKGDLLNRYRIDKPRKTCSKWPRLGATRFLKLVKWWFKISIWILPKS